MRVSRQVGFRLLALLLAAGVVVSLLEVGLRVFGYEGESDRQIIHFSPISPPKELAEARWAHAWPMNPVEGQRVRVNQEELPLNKPEGQTRVLFVGDSATFGFGVRHQDAFPGRVAELLGAQCAEEDVEVINAGIQGINTVVEYFLLEQKLIHLSPDIVVLGVFLQNDINTDLFSHRRLVRYQHGSRFLNRVRDLREHSALIHFLYLRLLAANDRVALLDSAGAWTRQALPVEFDALTPDGLNLGNYVEGEYALYQSSPAPVIDEAYALLESLLVRMRNLCRETGCSFVPLIIPTPAQAGGRISPTDPSAHEALEARGFSVLGEGLDYDRPTEAVLEICARQGLLCVDPLERIRKLGHEAVFIQDDVHPSVKGHLLLAEQVYEALGESGALPTDCVAEQ
ncbi:MAG: SGNH/GDSL hydrolase family protein [Myxococcota bacterium]|nr:SGNH/GDSL hydrolase family protein [Myxococcota bacterium]